MIIPKINAYVPKIKNYQVENKAISFAKKPTPQECFDMTRSKLYNKYGGYCTILTYNEIMAMKDFAEKSKKGKYIPNLAIAFFNGAIIDSVNIATQEQIENKYAQWENITDVENI